jgi:large subunit ribosomal protein L16
MLQEPKKFKYKKLHKGKSFNKLDNLITLKNLKIDYIKIITLNTGRITARQIKASKAIIKKGMKKKGIIKSNMFPYNSITKKPNEIRMGKGKGSVNHWVFNSKAGTHLFEIKTVFKKKLKVLLNKVKKRLPIKVKII